MSSRNKLTEIQCVFEHVRVTSKSQTKHFSNYSVHVEAKCLLVGPSGNYKVPMKKITSLECNENGFDLTSEKIALKVWNPQNDNVWQNKQKVLLEKLWSKKVSKAQRKADQKDQEEQQQERQVRRSYRSTVGKSYSKRVNRFLKMNERNNAWDSDGDEETFNAVRPKRQLHAPYDDDDEVEATFDDDKNNDNEEEEGIEGNEVETSFDDDDYNDNEEGKKGMEVDLPMESVVEESEVPKKKKKLKKKKYQDDSDDDDYFGKSEMTTPNAAQRIVSPPTNLMNRLHDDDDSEEDDEQEVMKVDHASPTKKAAPTKKLDSFFVPVVAKRKAPPVSTSTKSVGQSNKTASFFAPKRSKILKSTGTLASTEEDTETVVPSQTPTVMASQASSEILTCPSTPQSSSKKPQRLFHSSFGHNDADEEEDPIEDPIDSPGDSRPKYRRNVLSSGKRSKQLRVYGSRDTAAMALELADAHNPKRSLSINITSPSRRLMSPPRNRPLSINITSPSRRLMSPPHNRPLSINIASPSRRLMSPPRKQRISTSPSRSRLSSPARKPYHSAKKFKSPMAGTSTPKRPFLHPNFAGLKNIGNTCYMNSSLQMLFTLPNFVQALPPPSKQGKLTQAIASLHSDMQQVPGNKSARDVKLAMDAVSDKFRGYQQRDAHEFLGDLLDTLDEELPSPKVTDEYFRWNVQVCLTCKSCGYSRSKEEMYRYLSVDIPSSSCTVQECLETFFQPEDREIKCEKCKEGKVATQTLKVLQKPKAMLLHLKRFVLSTDNKMVIFRKNKAPVQLLETVDNDYKLHSVVHHIGNTASSGHYTADAVRQLEGKEQWVSFDDTHVKDTTLDKALKDRNKQTTSYMMLYTSS